MRDSSKFLPWLVFEVSKLVDSNLQERYSYSISQESGDEREGGGGLSRVCPAIEVMRVDPRS